MKEKSAVISEEERFKAALRKASLKTTPQRLAIHGAMRALGHASADMVVDYLQLNSQIKVTVASVYNNLSQLADAGIYSYRLSANNKMYFDITASEHFHVYDCVNHTFRDLVDDKLRKEILEKIGKRRFKGYRLEGIDIQFIVKPRGSK